MSEPKRQDPLVETLTWAVAIMVIVGLLALFLRPMLYGPHYTSSANACINNLRQIDTAANEFALENGRTNGYVIHFPNDLTPYIKLDTNGNIPHCPAGGTYHLTRVGDAPICSLGTTITPAHILP